MRIAERAKFPRAFRRPKSIERQRDLRVKTVDDLSFTSRDTDGRINWWDVQKPKTQYWHVHETLGRAYAYELLDLLHNPDAKLSGAEAGCILRAAAMGDPSIADGFFSAIGKFLTIGDIAR